MSNMSYCRFYNTYHDMLDCLDALENGEELSEEEQVYRDKMMDVCQEILNFKGDNDEQNTSL